MNDLELVSTEDLITELVNRSTFQGVVINRPDGYRGQWKDGPNNFQVSFNNLDRVEVPRLMAVVSEFIQTDQYVQPDEDYIGD